MGVDTCDNYWANELIFMLSIFLLLNSCFLLTFLLKIPSVEAAVTDSDFGNFDDANVHMI